MSRELSGRNQALDDLEADFARVKMALYNDFLPKQKKEKSS
jgi:hypothetical protein